MDERKKSDLSTKELFREETKIEQKELPKSILFSGSKSHAKFNVKIHWETFWNLKLPLQASATSVLSKSLEKQETPVDVDLNVNINNLHAEDMKRYVDNLKKMCK